MPRYFFTIRWPEHQEIDEHGTQLKDDDAALNHACRLVRELQAHGGYDNPALALHVSCESRQMVLSIPFLAACA
jgi:hypothetical protein